MRLTRRVSLAVLSVIGLGLTGVLAFDVYEDWVIQGNTPASTLVENALPFVLLLGLFYVVWTLWHGAYDATFVAAVTKWTVVGVVATTVLVGWIVGVQSVQNGLKPWIIVLQTAVIGAVSGLLVGRRTAILARERDRRERERDRFRSLFENHRAGIADLRLDGDRLLVESTNPQFDSQFGATDGETLGERLPNADPAEVGTLRDRTAAQEGFVTETTQYTLEGRKHYTVDLVPYGADWPGDQRRSYVIYQDITDIRETEAELERTVEKLERSNEQLQQFAYVASHDLQEPLRMVSSYVDLLATEYGDELDDEADEYIEFAVDGAQRMQSMINDLLTYSRVHTQGQAFEETDPDEVLDQVSRDLELLLAERDATLTSDDLPSVVADENQLGQLFQNLVANAVEHASTGSQTESDDTPPEVHVSGEKRGEVVRFSVSDNGPGVPPDQQDRIFELFEQSSRDDEGTGIGLAICKRIVNRHEGDIWVESTEGEGATFHVELPDRSPQQSKQRGKNP